MLSAIFAFAGALLVAMALTPVVRRFAIQFGAMDAPSERRVHVRAIPRLGGLGIAVAFFASLLALFITESEVAQIFFAKPKIISGLALGGLVVCALGALDDVRGVRAWHKLWVQCLAAAAAYACGFRIDAIKLPLFGHLDMGVFGIAITALWIVTIVNAINLIDGLDGLAGGVAFFACITNFVVGAINNDVVVMLLSAALAGAVLGFLLFNFSPASIFMGDSGSMFLGFVLATTSILGNSVKSSTTVALLVPFVALGLPIVDTLLAMLRRFLERRSIFAADRGHIHHQLLAMGLTHRRAVLTLYVLSILFTASAIVVSVGRNAAVGAALVVITITVVAVVRTVGNLDVTLRRWVRKERIRPASVDRIRHAVPWVLDRIACTRDGHELGDVLREFAIQTRLETVELSVDIGQFLEPFSWTRAPTDPNEAAPATVHAVYPLPAPESSTLSFSWVSETGEVGPETEILLQLVADAVGSLATRTGEARRSIIASHVRSV